MKKMLCLLGLMLFLGVVHAQHKPVITSSLPEICPKKDSAYLLNINPRAGSKYQWYYNGKPLPNDTTKTLYAKKAGKYQLAVTEPVFQTINPQPSMSYVNDIFFLNDKQGWAVGVHNKFIKTTDGGKTWTELDAELPDNENLTAVSFYDENTGYVLGKHLYKTTDGGITWSRVKSLNVNLNDSYTRNTIQIIDKNHLVIEASFNYLYISSDGGNTWNQPFKTGTITGVAFKNADEGIAVISIGSDPQSVYKTTDGGKNWSVLFRNTNGRIREVEYASEDVYYINNIDKGIILKTTDGGRTWIEKQVRPNTGAFGSGVYDIEFIDDKTGFARNSFTDIAKTTDGGDTWIKQGTAPTYTSWIVALNANDFIVWGGQSTIWKFAEPNKFVNANTPLLPKKNYVFTSLDGNNHSFTITSRYGNELVYTNNSGASFNESPNLGFAWSNRLSFINEATGWYLVESSPALSWVQVNKVLFTKDSSKTWTQLPALPKLPSGAYLRDIYFSDDKEGWICGEKGVILHSQDGGQSWEFQLQEGQEMFQRIQFIGKQLGWALSTNAIFKTTDGGKSWVKKYTMSYPITNYGYSIDLSFVDKDFGWVCGGLYPLVTKDGGETWEIIPNSSLALGRSIKFIDKNTGFFMNHSLWKTVDGGKNWNLVSQFFGGNDFILTKDYALAVRDYNEIKKYVFNPKTTFSDTIRIREICFLKCWLRDCFKKPKQ